ncbi:hypothetical protein OUZ56_025932 [Daphnia magna]|uniref:Uncharacterized protein n=1 Tax=Daphnia magna TaxID=35525 RepID=A0ABQ9ZKE9_9CRUS|nr:hypothetical protein OUZ56_025932 [Daphnia magna]
MKREKFAVRLTRGVHRRRKKNTFRVRRTRLYQRPNFRRRGNGRRRGLYDQPGSMENAYQRKYDKYSSHGGILPLVVGSLGSWYPRTAEIRSILGINGRSWGAFRFKARLAAIQGSMDMVCAHFHHGAPNPEAEDISPFPVETPYPED